MLSKIVHVLILRAGQLRQDQTRKSPILRPAGQRQKNPLPKKRAKLGFELDELETANKVEPI